MFIHFIFLFVFTFTSTFINSFNYLSIDVLISLLILLLISILASYDVHDVCPHVSMMSCPLITLESGETVQLIPKPMQPDLDWLISDLQTDLQIPDDVRRYYCTEPGRTYMQML